MKRHPDETDEQYAKRCQSIERTRRWTELGRLCETPHDYDNLAEEILTASGVEAVKFWTTQWRKYLGVDRERLRIIAPMLPPPPEEPW